MIPSACVSVTAYWFGLDTQICKWAGVHASMMPRMTARVSVTADCLPVGERCVQCTRRSFSAKVEDVAAHLRKAGPWFDRKKGADHIFAVSGDFGR